MPNKVKKLTIVVENTDEVHAKELAEAMIARLENIGHKNYRIRIQRDNKPKIKNNE